MQTAVQASQLLCLLLHKLSGDVYSPGVHSRVSMYDIAIVEALIEYASRMRCVVGAVVDGNGACVDRVEEVNEGMEITLQGCSVKDARAGASQKLTVKGKGKECPTQACDESVLSNRSYTCFS